MALINPVAPDQAEGIVKEGYEMFMQKIGAIPRPMEMLSVSPEMFKIQLRRLRYLSTHPRLGFSLLTHIRYLVAHSLNYQSCKSFNKYVLQKQGVTEEDFAEMEQDPSQSLLADHERAMLVFVIKAVHEPLSVGKDDIENMRQLGWQDSDMMDALIQGVSMIDHSIMMQVFQMDQHCPVK